MLIVTLSSTIVWILVRLLHFTVIDKEEDLLAYAISGALENILTLLGIVTLSVFVHYLRNPTIATWRIHTQISFWALITGIIMVHVAGAISGDLYIVDTASQVVGIFNPIALLWNYSLIFYDLRSLLKENLGPQQRKQIIEFSIGISISIIGFIPVLIIASLFGADYLIFGFPVLSIGYIFLIRAFLRDTRIIFALPEQVYMIMVVNKSGVEMYKHLFDETNEPMDINAKTFLLSGALNVVMGIFTEFFEQPTIPKSIEFNHYNIVYEWADDFFIAVFTKYTSLVILNALSQLRQEIEFKYGSEINSVLEGISMLDLDDEVKRLFSFIYFE
ncbi:MAG: hypothetical protein INQ03_23995 [Candidatus Heimdallarchaeota archaeon]|nr:hypothetical protein [Candidatus Heimdallarchaeota archaeon]